jgi:uncharacterized membrane protein YebE (DUF533 family)
MSTNEYHSTPPYAYRRKSGRSSPNVRARTIRNNLAKVGIGAALGLLANSAINANKQANDVNKLNNPEATALTYVRDGEVGNTPVQTFKAPQTESADMLAQAVSKPEDEGIVQGIISHEQGDLVTQGMKVTIPTSFLKPPGK